ncbi:MAG: hypothetical protein R2822_17955 [Spirosomataceae bacterium]
MQDLPDDELDQLFRKSAEEFERPFNPQAWNAMRQKLDDEDDQVGAIFWRKTSAIAVLLLVVGLGGYYLWESKPTRNISKNQTQNQVIAPNRPPMNQTNHSQKNE